ncbi:MAG: excalibur calcium-binding domain-containing protein [Solirubrobacterales bacterium]
MPLVSLRRIAALALALVALVALAAALVAQPAAAFQDRDCADFATQKKAQHYFKKHGGPRHDPSRLDADHDGIACEDNP